MILVYYHKVHLWHESELKINSLLVILFDVQKCLSSNVFKKIRFCSSVTIPHPPTALFVLWTLFRQKRRANAFSSPFLRPNPIMIRIDYFALVLRCTVVSLTHLFKNSCILLVLSVLVRNYQ